MLSELRKYRVGFTIAHQYLHRLAPDIRHPVLGNAGTIISFRVGAEDAPFIAREFKAHHRSCQKRRARSDPPALASGSGV
jgi:hypothetical protein